MEVVVEEKEEDLVLTKKEREFFDRVSLVWRLRRARTLRLEVTCPAAPKLSDQSPDVKSNCARCKRLTSLTLLNSENICGVCVWRSDQGEEQEVQSTASRIGGES